MNANSQPPVPVSRRQFFRDGSRLAAMTGIGGLIGVLGGRSVARGTVWQIDPQKCVRCGLCATSCVLEQSAAKCVHAHAICGYCQLCTGYFEPSPNDLNTGAENQLCPTAAIKRTFVEDPYYEYTIEERLCIGCAKCVEGCNRFGNGSLYLQVRHDRCVNCNECAISRVCPSDAFRRVPSNQSYLVKHTSHGT
jgi:electron transport complex protein RnfB